MKVADFQYSKSPFRTPKKKQHFVARCVFVPTNFGKFSSSKTILPFLKKGEKTAELVFLCWVKFKLRVQTNPIYSFLIFIDSRLIQSILN
jgi:hypothetical protein